MDPIPFVGPTYTAQSINADAQLAINFFLEVDQRNLSKRAPMVLYGTPGLRKLGTVGNGPIRGLWPINNALIVVSGSGVYVVTAPFVVKQIGSLNTSSGYVCLRDNEKQVIIVDGKNGYLITVSNFSFQTITDPYFQNGAKFVEYQNTFFFTSGDGSAFMRSSQPLDGSTWAGPDATNIETKSLTLLRAIGTHNELVAVTPINAEIWVNQGLPAFPYAQSTGVLVEHGCAAPASIVNVDNTLIWLGRDETGIGPVWKAKGYDPEVISNSMIDREFQSYGDVSDAIAFAYQQNNHLFYVLTFPSADKTWVYDVSTGFWHQRAWFDATHDSFHRWRPNAFAFWNNQPTVGDFQDGRIYAIDPNYYYDDTGPLVSLRRSQTFANDQKQVIYNRIQVDMQTGLGQQGLTPTAVLQVDLVPDVLQTDLIPTLLAVSSPTAAEVPLADPQAWLRWSNDGGHTWSSKRYASLGRIGRFQQRVIFNRCGRGRNRVWEFGISDPVPRAILGALANMTECFE